MRRQGSGFGVVILLLVVAIILYLAARNWHDAAPPAVEVLRDGSVRNASQPDRGGMTGEDVPPLRPSLGEMKQQTDAHGRYVQEGLGSNN